MEKKEEFVKNSNTFEEKEADEYPFGNFAIETSFNDIIGQLEHYYQYNMNVPKGTKANAFYIRSVDSHIEIGVAQVDLIR